MTRSASIEARDNAFALSRFFLYTLYNIISMIGVRKNTKKFSRSIFFLMFFFAFFVHFHFDTDTAYAEGPVAPGAITTAQEAAAKVNPSGDGTAQVTPKSTETVGEDACWPNWFCTGIKAFLYGIFTFVAFLAMLAAQIFSYVLNVEHFQSIMGNVVIYEMWRIVRDFFNLFFIFSLLIVAFSTIFQVSKYGGLKSIWNIVLAALFINFSFPIARMVIDVGNVMMYSFINDIFGMTASSLTSGVLSTSGIKDLLLPGGFNSSLDIKFYLIIIVAMFMFGVSFLTLSLMMFYRLFMLPILVMFSPIGFAGSAIPGMSGYSSQWWDKLIKNVFFGPIAVFMVMIAVKFLGTLTTSNIAKNQMPLSQDMVNLSAGSGTILAAVVYMTIPIIFFWIAITSAEKLSSEASGMANAFGSKFLKWSGGLPWRGTKGVAGWAGRKVESKLASGKYTKFLSPSVVTSAVKAWSDTSKHEDMLPIEMAKAEMHNQINGAINAVAGTRLGKHLPLHKDRADYVMLEQMKQMKQYEDEIKQRSGGEANEDTARVILKEAIAEHNKAKFMAAASILAKNNGLDNIVADLGNPTEKAMGITGGYATTMQREMKALGIDEQMQYKFMHNLGETAKSKGDLAFGDHVTVDAGTGVWSINADHDATVAGNFKKMKAQTRQDVVHPRAFFEQDMVPILDATGSPVIDPATGHPKMKAKIGDMSLTGSELAAVINADDVNSSNRMRGDTQAAFKGIWEELHSTTPAINTAAHAKYTQFKAAYNKVENQEFRNYVWQASGHPKVDPSKGVIPPPTL